MIQDMREVSAKFSVCLLDFCHCTVDRAVLYQTVNASPLRSTQEREAEDSSRQADAPAEAELSRSESPVQLNRTPGLRRSFP